MIFFQNSSHFVCSIMERQNQTLLQTSVLHIWGNLTINAAPLVKLIPISCQGEDIMPTLEQQVILHKVRLVIFFNRILEPNIHHRSQGCFPHQQAILTPAESPKFNSILTLPGTELESTGCGFSPYPGTSPPQHTLTLDASLKSRLLPALLTNWLYIRGSHKPHSTLQLN